MKIEAPSDWYRVTLQDIESKGGLSVIHHMYNGSLSTALQTIYPELSLSWYQFQKVPRGYWEDINNVRAYLQYLADQYCLSNINDWMYFNESQIPKFHIIKKHHGNLPKILQKLFPGHKLTPNIPRQSKTQLFLSKMVQSILSLAPGQLEYNYKHPTLIHKNTNRHMEFDIFIKPFNVVVEYHGPHHYHWWYLNGDPSNQMRRDQEKKSACQTAGITYLSIPYWWDKQPQSLAATILHYRPDLKKHITLQPGVVIAEQPTSNKEHQRAMQASQTTLKHGQEKYRMPYCVTLGRKRGYPRCRGCHKLITNPDEPRITIQGQFKPTSLKPFPVKYSVCSNEECLQKALQPHSQKVTSHPGIVFPKFDGKIGISPNAKEKLIQVPWKLSAQPITFEDIS